MTLVVLVAVLVAGGVYLLLDDDPVRLVLGAGLLGHGAVLGLVTVMRAGRPPLVGSGSGVIADPLPQALALTAIVIAFGVAAYLLAFTRASATREQTRDGDTPTPRSDDTPAARRDRAADDAGPVTPGGDAPGDAKEAAWSG